MNVAARADLARPPAPHPRSSRLAFGNTATTSVMSSSPTGRPVGVDDRQFADFPLRHDSDCVGQHRACWHRAGCRGHHLWIESSSAASRRLSNKPGQIAVGEQADQIAGRVDQHDRPGPAAADVAVDEHLPHGLRAAASRHSASGRMWSSTFAQPPPQIAGRMEAGKILAAETNASGWRPAPGRRPWPTWPWCWCWGPGPASRLL